MYFSNIGIVGCGGREHAIGKALIKNNDKINLFYIGSHKNIGLDLINATYENIDICNSELVLLWAKNNNLEFVIIGPEQPLECGIVNILEDNNIKCLGPRRDLAMLETSKLFCRTFLSTLENKFDIKLNPDYYYYYDKKKLIDNLKIYDKKFVIKQDILAGGKGVLVMDEHFKTNEEGIKICLNYFEKNIPFHIEEKLEGEEFSLISITDGINIQHCPPIQDYKRLYENGPNTGGMGCMMNCLSFLSSEDIGQAEKINTLVTNNIKNYIKSDHNYKGILYGSFIKTENGIRVIEYNCRFGDPEVICLLDNMQSDFSNICYNIAKENLTKKIIFDKSPTLTKYIVPEGYPTNSMKNYEFYIHKINDENITWANCIKKDNHYIQLGSRTFAYTLKGDHLLDIKNEINRTLSKVQGRVYFREDIGSNILIKTNNSKYADSGVNIETGNTIVKEIQKYIKDTENDKVISDLGGFNGMVKLGDTILVSSMDGVGTKSIFVKNILGEYGLEYLGMDLVSHCINDILVSGAKPLFFLDYFASSKLSPNEVVNFVKGVSKICKQYNIILAGGETAEMPQVYNEHHCDLVGTIVGTVTENTMIKSKQNIKKNDIILGLKSNGLHPNGYSLLRKLLVVAEEKNLYPSKDILARLCNPHKCYLDEVNEIQKKITINGLCHITGGGFIDNPPRVLSSDLSLDLNKELLFNDPIYDWIKSLNYVTEEEMMQVFNCGFGMLVFISPDDLNKLNDDYIILGKVV